MIRAGRGRPYDRGGPVSSGSGRKGRSGVLGAMQRFVASSWAPWALLALTLVLHVLATLAGTDPFAMVDLRVYLEGAQHLFDGTLYDFFSEPLHLPFTYPTFSAIIFTPTDLVALDGAAVAVAGRVVRVAIGLIDLLHACVCSAGPAECAAADRALCAASSSRHRAGLWLEPVRTTFNYGQINLFLCALLLAGAVASEGMARRGVGRAGRRHQADSRDHRAVLPAAAPLVGGACGRWSFFAGTIAVGLLLVSRRRRSGSSPS